MQAFFRFRSASAGPAARRSGGGAGDLCPWRAGRVL